MKKFRLLRADEIDCRVNQIRDSDSTCTLLLYKDARCDMNILDETVGAFNWSREHVLIDGQLFCRVGICMDDLGFRTENFIWKEDVGTESYTEAEKGRASDSFKRACVNWGIGRELYSAPDIRVKCHLSEYKGKKTTWDRFEVAAIGYDARENINYLVITKDGAVVFEYDKRASDKPTTTHLKALRALMEQKGVSEEQVCDRYAIQSLEDMSMETYTRAANALDKSKGKA